MRSFGSSYYRTRSPHSTLTLFQQNPARFGARSVVITMIAISGTAARAYFRQQAGRTGRRQCRVILNDIVREKSRVMRSNSRSRPAHRALDLVPGNPEIAKHMIVHACKFFDGATSCPFGFDRRLHCFQDREKSIDGISCDLAPPRLAPRRSANAMDFIERSLRMHFH